MPIGASLAFETVSFTGSDSTQVPQGVINWTFFEGALLAICLRTADSDKVIGTAVVVAPGLAVSATHVIQGDLPAIMDGTASLLCTGITSTGVQLWRVRKASMCPADDDTCFLSLEMASSLEPESRLRRFALTARAPTIGESLHVIGYQLPEVNRSAPNGGFSAGGALYLATGVVTDFFPNGRDKRLMPYPSIEIACGTLCGMSGGAVLDRDGCLMGVISRGWDFEDGSGPSYAAWIVGALLRAVEIPWPPGFYRQPTRLWDIDPAALVIAGRENVRIAEHRPE